MKKLTGELPVSFFDAVCLPLLKKCYKRDATKERRKKFAAQKN